MADKGGFPHYMLKEIFEQPKGLRDTIEPRVSLEEAVVRLDDVRISTDELRALRRINIVASGTSRHAGMAGQYMIQDLVNIPVDVDYASEFEYRNPLIGPGELTIVITQSGETADTTAAQREAKAKGSRTKAFTAQMAVLYLFALYLGQVRGKFAKEQRREYIRELLDLPGKMEVLLKSAPAACEQLAEKYYKVQDFLFMGRAIHYPVAMDGALKLKEVSYIHAEGYPTGETKHGPNAMIDENLPVVIIATCDREDSGSVLRYEKNLANIRGFKQQSARVIAIATEGDQELPRIADHTIFVPQATELLLPLLEIIPLQLFAYYMTVKKGLDVDRPRNLVKSVTLE
jgi:glucosamine--fructose-6-phosphate aminotransferase (isomerizing)